MRSITLALDLLCPNGHCAWFLDILLIGTTISIAIQFHRRSTHTPKTHEEACHNFTYTVSTSHFRYHILVNFVLLIFFCNWKTPYSNASAVGGPRSSISIVQLTQERRELTARHINIDRYNPIATPHNTIAIMIVPPSIRTTAHRDNPPYNQTNQQVVPSKSQFPKLHPGLRKPKPRTKL